MVSNGIIATGVSVTVVAFATFIGGFTNGIFEDTAAIFQQINSGQTVTVESVISDADMNRFKNIPAEVEKMRAEQEETK